MLFWISFSLSGWNCFTWYKLYIHWAKIFHQTETLRVCCSVKQERFARWEKYLRQMGTYYGIALYTGIQTFLLGVVLLERKVLLSKTSLVYKRYLKVRNGAFLPVFPAFFKWGWGLDFNLHEGKNLIYLLSEEPTGVKQCSHDSDFLQGIAWLLRASLVIARRNWKKKISTPSEK